MIRNSIKRGAKTKFEIITSNGVGNRKHGGFDKVFIALVSLTGAAFIVQIATLSFLPLSHLLHHPQHQNLAITSYHTKQNPGQDNQPVMSSQSDDHLQQLIRRAGAQINAETSARLPKWEDVVNLYGSEPLIRGLDTCEAFRASTPKNKAYIGVAGIFNSGTNLLNDLLSYNCRFPAERAPGYKKPIRWQVPWGKHSPEYYRFHHVAFAWGVGVEQKDVLPVVLIKDPYSWMGSMCRHKYTTNWHHRPEHCPNLIPNDVDKQFFRDTRNGAPIKVRIRYNATHFTEHTTLAGLWNDWYSAYYNVTYPRLIIRFEDLLFHPEEVVKKACECGGGKMTEKFRYTVNNAKPEIGPHVGTTSGMVAAIERYGNSNLRMEGFTEDDLKYAKENLHPEIMETFHYKASIKKKETVNQGNKVAVRASIKNQASEILLSKSEELLRNTNNKAIRDNQLVNNAPNDDHLQQLIRRAGARIDAETNARLPKWEDVVNLYGSEPRIEGLDTCEAFRASTPKNKAYIGVAGIFNTGTNLFTNFLKNNCHIPNTPRARGYLPPMRWQVPWGKHSPEYYRFHHIAIKEGQGVEQKDVLPVVIVKDPYSWMGSMCRHKYATNWHHRPEHCPNLIPNDVDKKYFAETRNGAPVSLRVRYNATHFTQHTSLAGLWNDWYSAYYNVTYPRLIIRFEDLLFHPEEVMTKACECGGGTLSKNFRFAVHNVKPEIGPHVGTTAGMVAAIERYGNSKLRMEGFTEDDLKYAKENLHPEIMDRFHYTATDMLT